MTPSYIARSHLQNSPAVSPTPSPTLICTAQGPKPPPSALPLPPRATSSASLRWPFTALSCGHCASACATPPLLWRPIAATSGGSIPFSWNFRRLFSSNSKHMPAISDPDIESAFKDFMAANWSELPDSLVEEAKKAVSKPTDDKADQEALRNVFRAAEACEEFSGVVMTLRMAFDDLPGLAGENVGPLPSYIEDAVKAAYNRYMMYLESFGPDETYLRKKVETELGTKMIHLKMRCSGIGSEWGKITLIGTSGISAGSNVELRA